MKKLVLSVVVLVCLVVVTAANFRTTSFQPTVRNACAGYTIIEFDKGVDCYGDTIKLVRINGFAERAF